MISSRYIEVANKHAAFLNPQFVKLLGTFGYGRLFVNAKGTQVWDDEGKDYLDFISSYGSVNVGHNHHRLLRIVSSTLEEGPYNFLHFGPNSAASDLSELLTKKLKGDFGMSLFSSSGSEAVEAAMKLAIATTKKTKFVFAENSYHGTGLGTLSVMGQRKLRKYFDSFLAQNIRVPFNSLPDLHEALKKKDIAAFIVEPIQCEGGVNFPSQTYLDEAKALCKKYGALMILDEVQTGFGRIGEWFYLHKMQSTPDIVVLAKALSGGIMPIGATVTTRDIFHTAYGSKDTFDLHGSTYGGNALSCRVAQETIRIIEEENLVERSKTLGNRLIDGLRKKLSGHPLIKDIRGDGLLVAIELGATSQGLINRIAPKMVNVASQIAFGQWVCYRLLQKGILIQPATHKWSVLKVEPPLTITEAELERFENAVSEVMDDYRSVGTLTKDITSRVTNRFFHPLNA